jgi:serine/threonine protein kinase
MAVSKQLISQVLDEKYRIEKQLGQGGMGAVYLATHLGTKRPVAIKVIAPQFMAYEEFIARFRREAEAAGRLRHPNVVNVTDFGFAQVGHEQLAYLVMEYLRGCSLGDMLATRRRLPLNWVIDIVEQICGAIDEAHTQAIIHRDLKPDNIWLELNGRGGYTVKVLDFGLAKLHDSATPLIPNDQPALAASTLSVKTQIVPERNRMEGSDLDTPTLVKPQTSVDEMARRAACTTIGESGALTRVGDLLGTPLYMSPEQCAGERIDGRSDIYSLGIITYQMLADETPFKGNIDSLIAQHLTTAPPSLDQKRPDLPKPVIEVVMSALEKTPAARPASAAAFANALRVHTNGASAILRQSLIFYIEHFFTFIRISLFGNIPFIISNLLLYLNEVLSFNLSIKFAVNTNLKIIAWSLWGSILLIILFLPLIKFANKVSTALFTPVVWQLLVTPLRPVKLHVIFRLLRNRLGLILTTTMYFFLLPGKERSSNYALYVPIIMMESGERNDVFTRSKILASRLPDALQLNRTLGFFNSFILVAEMMLSRLIIDTLIGLGLELNLLLRHGNSFIILVMALIFIPGTLLGIFINTTSAILPALLYFKTRQAGGETIEETPGPEFEEKTFMQE